MNKKRIRQVLKQALSILLTVSILAQMLPQRFAAANQTSQELIQKSFYDGGCKINTKKTAHGPIMSMQT